MLLKISNFTSSAPLNLNIADLDIDDSPLSLVTSSKAPPQTIIASFPTIKGWGVFEGDTILVYNPSDSSGTIQPVKVRLSSTVPSDSNSDSTSDSTIVTDEATATSLKVHSHIRNEGLRKVCVKRSPEPRRAEKATFLEVGMPPDLAHRHVPLEKSFVGGGETGGPRLPMSKVLEGWVEEERVVGWNR